MNSNTDERRDDFVSDASQAQDDQAPEENAKFILKNDPQTGLHLDEGDSDDCYEISASQEAPEPPTPPKPEIEEPAPGADDVYALAEPEPRPTPDQGIAPKEPGGGVAPAASRAKSNKRAKSDEEDDVSVESLYERRRRALAEEEEQKLIVERDPLPPPILDGYLQAFPFRRVPRARRDDRRHNLCSPSDCRLYFYASSLNRRRGSARREPRRIGMESVLGKPLERALLLHSLLFRLGNFRRSPLRSDLCRHGERRGRNQRLA